MNAGDWLGIPIAECARLTEQLGAGNRHPVEVIAAIASSVMCEPGDATWGECVAAHGVIAAVEALVASVDPLDFARRLDIEPDAELCAGWSRWSRRVSAGETIAAAERARHVGATLLLPGDPAWPEGLYDLGPHMPHLLYVRGVLGNVWPRAVAVVGARAATGYGEHVASELSSELSENGHPVVSGGAYGIDGVAHRSALASGGSTIAFLAGGIDRLYPSGHAELLQRIIASGAVIAEHPCGASPTRFRFLQRNRLIAAASRATVVVEAGRRSGSLNTAGHAAALGRPIGAVPGPVTSPASAGCHHLLRDCAAICITTAQDVIDLAWFSNTEPTP